MKNTIALATVAGIASIAAAQTVSVVADNGTIESGDDSGITVSFSIIVDDDAGIDIEGFDLAVTTDAGTLSNAVVLQPGFAGTAQIDGGRVEVAAADSFGGEANDYQTGFTLATFDLTFDAGFIGTATLTLSAGDNSVLGNQGFPLAINTGGFPPIPAGLQGTLNGASYTITPTPGAAAVLGLGGLVAARRRR